MINFVNQFLIWTGALFILFATIKSIRLMPKLAKYSARYRWLILITLMVFFIFGYLYAIYMVNQDRFHELYAITSIIFGAGGLFVFIAISIATNTIKMLSQFNSELEKIVEERTMELIDHKAKAITSSKLSALGEMAAGIAHEINNPLTIINGRVMQLRKMNENNLIDMKLFSDYTSQIHDTVVRISKIINGLRHFARDTGNESLEDVRISDLITSTSDLCSERMANNNIDFKVMSVPDLTFTGRSVQISQVLLNLLNNSFDAIQNQNDKKITISFGQIPGFIEIIVSDNGPGIPPEIQEKIMNPFFSTKAVGKGMGLGLSISKGILEEHHGKLYYKTTPSETKFIIQLPVSKTEII